MQTQAPTPTINQPAANAACLRPPPLRAWDIVVQRVERGGRVSTSAYKLLGKDQAQAVARLLDMLDDSAACVLHITPRRIA
ncbi:hypothetical protein [Vandammella animalimorsus]|uniref:Uncharacterized protein n=1 Tax=Vandammella animalimorsus TaxID=2029117 RepID=A0A2A2A8T0_9BURK|nr:hypothetical protein [Vandammella animalimorsus]PAT34940.1 hypothetical protein CK625_12530 [Vandammella animalimorsus]